MTNIHPALVHFPVALLLASPVFDLAARVWDKQGLRQAGWWSLVAGVVSGVAAAVAGLFAAAQAHAGEAVGKLILLHELLAMTALILFGLLLAWRKERWGVTREALPWGYFVGALLSALVLAAAARQGGVLVYDHGLGTSLRASGQAQAGEPPARNGQGRPAPRGERP